MASQKGDISMRTKLRIIYCGLFCVVLFVEVCIALFAHDAFIRPYLGDVLVSVLICCLGRTLFPQGVQALPMYVFLFSAAVELGQYFDIVAHLGLADNRFFSVLLGRTFSVADLFCYAAGCLGFFLLDTFVKRRLAARNNR